MYPILEVYNHGLKKLGRLDSMSLGGKNLEIFYPELRNGLVQLSVQLYLDILVLGLLLLIFL